jgi:hypothetical protein
MSMQFTAYSIADLWDKGIKDFYLYELTKTNKVLKHKIRDLIEFDNCIIIAIGDDNGKNQPKHKLIFSASTGTKRILGDSVYYTDFSAVKSQFTSKNGAEELSVEIEDLKVEIKLLSERLDSLKDVLESKQKKHERLIEGMSAEYLQDLEAEDKMFKDKITSHLKKKIYHYAERYGTDLSFTFLVDRIALHNSKDKKELIELYKDTSNEDLEKILSSSLVDIKN